MDGFIVLNSALLRSQRETGEAIMRLISSAGDERPGTEWSSFIADPRVWLMEHGYVFVPPGGGPSGPIPTGINLVPMLDTADTMHVRIPWKGVLDQIPNIEREDAYGPAGPSRFPIFLARYFMRRCR